MTSMCLFGTLYALLPAVFVVLFRVCLSVKKSKACYGASGLPCTKHTLECSSGMIAIQDAYYTNSTACTSNGLSSCNINVSSIPDTGRHRDFNETQLKNLYKKCSNQQSCTFNGVRRSFITFSVVKFICTNVKKSKACYGASGLPCTKHTLECSNGKIAIQDAYYTNSTVCVFVGLSSCNINISSIPDTGRHRDFNETQLDNLYKKCSNQQSCTFDGVGQSFIIFSVVKFICTNAAQSTTDSISTVNSPTTSEIVDTSNLSPSSVSSTLTTSVDTSNLSPSSVPPTLTTSVDTSNLSPSSVPPTLTTSGASSTGTVIAVVIPCLLIIVAIVLIAVIVIRRKKSKTTKKDGKTNQNTKSQEEYSLAGDVHQNEYFEIEKSPTKMAKTDYDNAGFEDTTRNASSKDHEVYSLAGVAHSNAYFEIEPTAPKKSLMAYDYAELSNTHASTSQNEENVGPTTIQVQEDDYDHVGGKPVIKNGHYDTTASVAKTLPKSNSTDKKGDVYSYDHLNDKTTTNNANNDYDVADRPSDYDTTASIQKRFDHATECREDDYGYNHLWNQVQKKTLHNDYDTSASAVTAVARLNSRTDDPDYDHLTQDTGVDSLPSSGDTPENNVDDSDVYSVARKGDNPYQLAK